MAIMKRGSKKMHNLRCNCWSQNLEKLREDKDTVTYKCNDCGNEVTFMREE